jgi:hypothetical protein
MMDLWFGTIIICSTVIFVSAAVYAVGVTYLFLKEEFFNDGH